MVYQPLCDFFFIYFFFYYGFTWADPVNEEIPNSTQANFKGFPICYHMREIQVYYIKVTAPQDVHGRLVLQACLGLNTLEFSVIRR